MLMPAKTRNSGEKSDTNVDKKSNNEVVPNGQIFAVLTVQSISVLNVFVSNEEQMNQGLIAANMLDQSF